jgi:hypothetical protein
MADIQTISIAVASAGVLLAAIYYIIQIQHQTKIRKTDLVMRLYSTLSNKEFEEAWFRVYNLKVKDYPDFLGKYGSLSDESPTSLAFSIVFNFFEGVAILLQRKLADIDLIYDLFGARIITTWDRFAPMGEEAKNQIEREFPIAKRSFLCIGYLYSEMKKYEQKLQQRGV